MDKKPINNRAENVVKALIEVSEWVEKNKGKAAQTTIKCPACGNELKVMKAACNDHTRGCCMKVSCGLGWVQ